MRALSIRQPWAWLIVNGHKDIENRDWETLYRGPVLIHAGKTLTKKYYAEVAAQVADWLDVELPPMAELQLGGIVGLATIAGCVRESESPWFMGEFGFLMRDAKPLPFTPWVGKLGFFHVPEADLASISSRAALAAHAVPVAAPEVPPSIPGTKARSQHG